MKKREKLATVVSSSLFGWEDSYFGGYERVIYDHPFIYIPPSLQYDFTMSAGLTWYTADKLCKIFLLKISKKGLLNIFVKDAIREEKTMFTGATVTIFNINKKTQCECIKFLRENDDEMGNLFTHYYDFLCEADFFYTIDDNGKESAPKGDGDSDGESEKPASDENFDAILKMFRQIESTVPSWSKPPSALSGRLKENTKFVVMDKKATSTVYTPQQIKMGNTLVNMLDISFEPKEDVIENLICGKMSPHKVAEIPAGNTHVYYKMEQDVSTRPFSICVLGDESGSMKGRCERVQNDLFKTIYYAFSQILPPQKMFFYGHSGTDSPIIRVYHELYNPNFEYTIDRQLHNDYRENYDGPVIENIYERVRQQTSDNIIFISISDGEPAGRGYGGTKAINDLKRVIERCKRDGFVTVGVGLRYGNVKDIYSYYTIVNDMSTLVKNVSSLINRVVKTEFKD